MCAGQDVAQILDTDARVDRRRLQAAVTEQLLHVADIGLAFDEMRRVRVPQGVDSDSREGPRAERMR
jgi:hypothetical protein